jgi:hypothetical protein
VNLRSGEPFNLTYTAAARAQVAPFLTLLGFNIFRPNISGDPVMPKDQRTVSQYLDRANASLPLFFEPFGNAGRNIGIGFAFAQVDLGISKYFSITDRIRLQFRTEAFNLSNRSNFRAPNSNLSSIAYGTITSTYDPRQLQLALKLQF